MEGDWRIIKLLAIFFLGWACGQFVERLNSAHEATDEELREMEREAGLDPDEQWHR